MKSIFRNGTTQHKPSHEMPVSDQKWKKILAYYTFIYKGSNSYMLNYIFASRVIYILGLIYISSWEGVSS